MNFILWSTQVPNQLIPFQLSWKLENNQGICKNLCLPVRAMFLRCAQNTFYGKVHHIQLKTFGAAWLWESWDRRQERKSFYLHPTTVIRTVSPRERRREKCNISITAARCLPFQWRRAAGYPLCPLIIGLCSPRLPPLPFISQLLSSGSFRRLFFLSHAPPSCHLKFCVFEPQSKKIHPKFSFY